MKLNCPYCGVENTFDDSLYGQNIICGACSKVFVGKPASMSSSVSSSVRRGITDAKFNEEMAGFVWCEILLLSIAAGFAASSWWCFGAVLLLLAVGVCIPKLSAFFCILASVSWGYLGFSVGKYFIEDIGASVVLFTIFAMASYGIHKAGLQYYQDVGKS